MGEFKSPSEKQSTKATPAKKSQENSSVAEADFLDSRSSTFQLKKFQEAAQDSGRGSGISSLQTKSSNHTGTSRIAQLQGLSDTRTASEQSALIQKKENKTGIPDGLKSGMESVSGISLNDVTVHRNSDKPAQLQAHAYAQGTDVHLAPGQEKHLPHELGHVVQQKQGRVAPTVQLKGQVAVNDNEHLEQEADTMGAKAQSLGISAEVSNQSLVAQKVGMEEEELIQGKFIKGNVVQLKKKWIDTHPEAQSDPHFKKHRPIWGPSEETPSSLDVSDTLETAPLESYTDEEVVAMDSAFTSADSVQSEEIPDSGSTEENVTRERRNAVDEGTPEVESSSTEENVTRKRRNAVDNGTPEKESTVKKVLGYAEKANTAAGGANTAMSKAFGKGGKINADSINQNASDTAGDIIGVGGVVFDGIKKFSAFISSGAEFWKTRDWESGAKFFTSAGEQAEFVLDTLAKYKALEEIPILSDAIGLFKAGVGIFKNNKELNLISKVEKENASSISKEEKKTLDRYVVKLKLSIASDSVDFALSIAGIVADFVPIAAPGVAIAKGAKKAFVAGCNAWYEYKSSKEKQALARIGEGSEAELEPEQKKKVEGLATKATKKEPKILKSSKGTLLDMVNSKMEIEEKKQLIDSTTDETEKSNLKSELDNMVSTLKDSISAYNAVMSPLGTTISFEDVENLQVIHSSVIREYLFKKDEHKSAVEAAKSFIGSTWLTSWIAPKKDKIMAELDKNPKFATLDNGEISELSKGENADYLWKKTQEALTKAAQDRAYFTKEELIPDVKKILIRYVDDKKIIEKIGKS
jgi:hypothetical protein